MYINEIFIKLWQIMQDMRKQIIIVEFTCHWIYIRKS